MDRLQKKEIIKLIKEYLDDYATENQYGVSKIPYHVHNGTDSPFIDANNSVSTTISNNTWIFDGYFTPASNVQVSWTGGTLRFSNGDTFDIDFGNTGSMSTVTYIYFDKNISQTDFQIGTSLTFGGTDDTGNHPMTPIFSLDGKYLYVSGNSATKKYDLDFNLLVTNSTVGASSGVSVPTIAIDDNYVYVADGVKVYKLLATSLVSVLDTTLPIDGVTISPDGQYLYGVDVIHNKLYKLYTSDLTQVLTAAGTANGPTSLGISPDGLTVYVLTIGGGLSAVQKFVASTLVGGTFTNTSGANAKSLAVSPNGTDIYATSLSAKVDKFSTALALSVAGTLSGGSQPFGITVSPNNTYVYVVDNAQHLLYKLNASDLTEVTHVTVPTSPSNVIASSDGNYIYVTTINSTIRRYNATDLTLSALGPLILGPDAIVVGVAQNVAATKNAIFEIFGGDALGGSGKLITGADLSGSIGTVTSGTWNGSVITPPYGGTGIANNAASTITITGNFATTLTVTNTTSVTLPVSGTLYGTASASITSAQLATSITDETGSGSVVFATSPTLVTPTIAKIANLTTNGFAKTSGGDGTLSIDTSTYLAKTDTVTLTGQVADIGSTNLTTTGAGLYRMDYYLLDATADITAGAVRLNTTYTDAASAQTQQSATVALTLVGSYTSGQFIIQLASGNIAYSTTHTGLFGTATYNLYITLERLN